jgi:hypothetical protein
MTEASATEKEKNDSGTEAFDFRLGEQSIANGEFVRALEGQDKGMRLPRLPMSSASMPRNMSPWEACYEREQLTGEHPKERLIYKI